MRFIIINWSDTTGLSDISIVLNEDDGTPKIFGTQEDAIIEMKDLNGEFQLIGI